MPAWCHAMQAWKAYMQKHKHRHLIVKLEVTDSQGVHKVYQGAPGARAWAHACATAAVSHAAACAPAPFSISQATAAHAFLHLVS